MIDRRDRERFLDLASCGVDRAGPFTELVAVKAELAAHEFHIRPVVGFADA